MSVKPSKVALVGFAMGTRHQTPFFDSDCEVWGLNELYLHIPRFDRWFQMHGWQELENNLRDGRHLEWLQKCDKPIYMQKHHKNIPMSIAYPLKEMVAEFGEYFTHTVAYMLALAIYEEFKEIHLYGIEMSPPHYIRQRPNVEYLIGIARGRGIKVHIPEESTFLRSRASRGRKASLRFQISHRLATLEGRVAKLDSDLKQVKQFSKRDVGKSGHQGWSGLDVEATVEMLSAERSLLEGAVQEFQNLSNGTTERNVQPAFLAKSLRVW